MIDHDLIEIGLNESNYNLSPQMIQTLGSQTQTINYQYWQFAFQCKEGCFIGKQISGVLKFPPEFPAKAPKFFFDPVPHPQQNLQVIQHVNIYGDHSLCIPLLTFWSSQTTTFEILQAIEHIFTNPNFAQGDAPANPNFNQLTEKERDAIQRDQAKYLKNFSKD